MPQDDQRPEELQATITALNESIANQISIRDRLLRRSEERKQRKQPAAAMERAKRLGWIGIISGGGMSAIAWLAASTRDKAAITTLVIGAVGGAGVTAAITCQDDNSTGPEAKQRPAIAAPAQPGPTSPTTKPPRTPARAAPLPSPTDIPTVSIPTTPPDIEVPPVVFPPGESKVPKLPKIKTPKPEATETEDADGGETSDDECLIKVHIGDLKFC